jgi:hypothetical protein
LVMRRSPETKSGPPRLRRQQTLERTTSTIISDQIGPGFSV